MGILDNCVISVKYFPPDVIFFEGDLGEQDPLHTETSITHVRVKRQASSVRLTTYVDKFYSLVTVEGNQNTAEIFN